jgi:hypothetical protein
VGQTHTEPASGWAAAGGQERPTPLSVPGSASSRETASQRAKLRALQRRHDPSSQPQQQQGAGLAEAGGGRAARVRNWNVRDDDAWRELAVTGAAPSAQSVVQQQQRQQQLVGVG